MNNSEHYKSGDKKSFLNLNVEYWEKIIIISISNIWNISGKYKENGRTEINYDSNVKKLQKQQQELQLQLQKDQYKQQKKQELQLQHGDELERQSQLEEQQQIFFELLVKKTTWKNVWFIHTIRYREFHQRIYL